jgi:hypothetical protein
VPHHGFVAEADLPSRPATEFDRSFSADAFPALKKERSTKSTHTPVYSPTHHPKRIGASIALALKEKPFYEGLQLSADLMNNLDLSLFGGREGMLGEGPPRPKSGRPEGPGVWRKPVNKDRDRGVLQVKTTDKKKKKKKKKVKVNIPNLSATCAVDGRSSLTLGTQGAPALWKYPLTNITTEFFPEEWKDSRNHAEVTVYKGIPVYTTTVDPPLSASGPAAPAVRPSGR